MRVERETNIDSLFKWLGLIGGGWIILELIKAFSKEVEVYSCSHCHNEIQEGISKCPHCGVKLVWKI
ncbi:MAG: zinc-ribbon domain-containing protein [Nitrospirota bacterium]